MATDRVISLPLWVSPLLTTKPPVSILMFLSVVRYIKLREKKFYATGRTKEQYNAFIDTNQGHTQIYAAEILTGMLILIVSFSVGLFYVEPVIETYFDALWYCFAIITTIGFGDITAVTAMGRIMSVILGIYGIIVVLL